MPRKSISDGKIKYKFHRLPVVSLSAEFLVMGYLMRRNILAYKAPPGNEGYDLICIHPDPRHQRTGRQKSQIRVQVKSRYATDAGRGFPLKEASLNAFDFVVVAFLNIGYYKRGQDGATGLKEIDFYTLPQSFVQEHFVSSSKWPKVMLGKADLEKYRNERGFELIAKALGVEQPKRLPDEE